MKLVTPPHSRQYRIIKPGMSRLADAFATDGKVFVKDGKEQGVPYVVFVIDIR